MFARGALTGSALTGGALDGTALDAFDAEYAAARIQGHVRDAIFS